LYTHTIILQHLRFGYGSALSVVVFVITFGLALIYIRGLGLRLSGEER
jgi:ABC-type sugar transport system permease subunit